MADRDAQFDQAEETFTEAVAAALDQVADEFAAAVDGATELVAARFSVGRIARMWGSRVSGLVSRLLGNAETAAEAAAEDVGAELPDGFEDLPGRYEAGRDLPPTIGEYVETTEHLLNAVGDRLAEVARQELATGLDAGEDIEQLRTRLRDAFTREGAQLGPGRESNVSQTEATRAWNTGTLAAGQALTGPDRPLVKQWLTRNDSRVRADHARVNGQLQLLDEPFTVGGVQMSAPGDPTAPPAQVCQCRCRLALATADRSAASDPQERPPSGFSDARESRVTTPESVTAAAAHTGAMIALMPTDADAERLALSVPGAEPPGELHLTLYYLGEGADWSEEQRAELIDGVRTHALEHGLADDVVHGRAFGANQWNADGDSPCWVWSVGDDPERPQHAPTLESARYAATYALEDRHGPDIPSQHTPHAAHICAVYTGEAWPLEELNARLGPLTFDRIRVAFAGEHTDIPLGGAAVTSTASIWVGGADVWDHGGHDTDRNPGARSAGTGGSHRRNGEPSAERMSPVRPDAVEESGVGVDAYGQDRAPGGRAPGGGSSEVRAADRAERGRAPHVPHAPLRGGDPPQPAPAHGARRAPHGRADTDGVLSPSASVRLPRTGQGLGGVPGVPAEGRAQVGGTEPGEAAQPAVQRRDQGEAPGGRPRAPRDAGVQGQGGGAAARPASPAEIRHGEATRQLTARGGRPQEAPMDSDTTEERTAAGMDARPWSTPGNTALAFENTETGDGRVFAAGALYWAGAGPWPLQYADEMLMGHEGAELAGGIHALDRQDDRITGGGVLYPSLPAGADALMLLEEKAALGVSVDLDDVSVEFLDRTSAEGDDEGEILLLASLPAASLMRLDDGSWSLTMATAAEWTASGASLSRTARVAQLITGPGGTVTAAAVHAALGQTGTLTAAAGDADDPDAGTVVHRESSGDLLMRITRARLRGATLVAMPAYDQARIVLDGVDPDDPGEPEDLDDDDMWAAAGPSKNHLRVVAYVKTSPVAVGARDVARALGMRMEAARGHLGRAAKAGRVVRLSRGLYVGPTVTGTETIAASDDVDLTGMEELEASAWDAMQSLPPMPAAWFVEPTAEELPPGSGGVHYANGRVYGWVAQAGVPHAGHPGKKITIERLAREGLDYSHFLRTEFELDDGSRVKAGAMTMNVGHDKDGAQCNDAVCQFDNSGTVGAIVTVGMSKGGLWFSGAGAPWLSTWDRNVFKACQPSYHLKGRRGGGWELRAVLDVPVPGHSSPLVAAVIERSNLALAASSAIRTASGDRPDVGPDDAGQVADTAVDQRGHRPDAVPDNRPDAVPAETVAAALLADGAFIGDLAAAIVTAQEEGAARRAEAAALAQTVAEQTQTTPRDEVERLAASVYATTTTGGEA
ncbi:phage minor head protein [Streptomyces sp. NPDC021019]|uniref:phage minor head protein n=1 Tax=Streptomyces sp. NPDC021019 TaxID=3365108 RepID=UPI0037B2482F